MGHHIMGYLVVFLVGYLFTFLVEHLMNFIVSIPIASDLDLGENIYFVLG